MTLLAQMDGCTMLGIGPKTLRNWLRHAKMQFSTHPTDARLKCLTLEQVQQLATLHARPLQMSPPASPAFPDEVTPCDSSQGHPAAAQAHEASPVSTTSSLSEEAELRKAVCGLEAKVLTLQEQLTQLTFELLRERSERYEQRLSALEALLSTKVSMCLFAHRTERFLSQLIRWSGLTGWLLSLLFALSGLRAVLPPTEKARRAVGKPIAPSTVAPTSVLLALPIA